MSRKEKIIANREAAQENYDTALFETANSEAYLELYKACREGVLSLISESAKSGQHEKDIIFTYIQELEDLTRKIIETQIGLMEDKQNLKEAYEASLQADKVYFDMLEDMENAKKGGEING